MIGKIISLNVGHPAPMEWNGHTIVSAMVKKPIPGPLVVHMDHIDDDSFNDKNSHGTKDSVLYAMGAASMTDYLRAIGRDVYEPGSLGENVTLDIFDEHQFSVGDVFQFGEVVAQATGPRFPCGKVNIRMQNAEGQKQMQLCGRSGIYFRILKPGRIHMDSVVALTESAKVRFPIEKFYAKGIRKERLTAEEFEMVLANGAFPENWVKRWSADRA